MGSITLTLEGHTKHDSLLATCSGVLEAIGRTATALSTEAGLPDCAALVVVTDDFVSEVQTRGREGLAPFTTERYGGMVAGITLPAPANPTSRTVLINSAFFTMDQMWTVVHLPAALAHEVAHCLLEHLRHQEGAPTGYVEAPADLLETVSHAAVTVCDEYLADQLAKELMPPLPVSLHGDEGESETTDRILLAVDALAQMREALDEHVYPRLRDRVIRYRNSGADLEGMIEDLRAGILSTLVLDMHYRAAIEGFPEIEEVLLVAQHPATRLYLTPFWQSVGPVLEERLAGPLWHGFGEQDQRMLDVANKSMLGFWGSLGVRIEPRAEGMYVHVEDPLDA